MTTKKNREHEISDWRQRAEADAHAGRKVVGTYNHPQFGEIPLLEVVAMVRGREIRYQTWDRDYRPPLPKGAVAGDPARQHFCPMCHWPHYFYVDQTRSCVACEQRFTFGAAEQKFWYESLKFHFDSVPIRCVACRKRERTARGLNQAVARAKAAWKADNSSPALALGVAEALVRLHERTGNGDLEEAVALARRAANLAAAARGQVAEALFWQAKAEVLRGASSLAAELFQQSLVALPTHTRGRTLRAEVAWHLAAAE